MRFLTKATSAVRKWFAPVDNRGGWWPFVREPYSGAWQDGEEWTADDISAFYAVYACITLIASDIGKMPFREVFMDKNGIWEASKKSRYPELLRKPNHYQNHIQFKQWWITTKLFRGNTYALIFRGASKEPKRLYILDPERVTVLVAPDGEVFYQLASDNLSGLESASITVPASEIIHDRMCCLFHPLVGISPLYASGLAASQGMKIQQDSSKFFSNGARPSGILTAPGAISQETADRLKAYWEENFTGKNAGKVAVLGDDLKFVGMRMTSADAQLVEQLKITAQIVCSTFHVPAYKVLGGEIPPNNNIEALMLDYYTQCLQILIEDMEACLDDGLGYEEGRGIELGTEALFRMDSKTLIETVSAGIKGGAFTPNEGRKKLNKPPLTGGDTVYMQEQNYSLEALNRRDAKDDPFAKSSANSSPTEEPTQEDIDAQARTLAVLIEKELQLANAE